MNNQYITASAAAKMLGFSRQYIFDKLIAKGKIKGIFRIGRNVMVPMSWVEWKHCHIKRKKNDAL